MNKTYFYIFKLDKPAEFLEEGIESHSGMRYRQYLTCNEMGLCFYVPESDISQNHILEQIRTNLTRDGLYLSAEHVTWVKENVTQEEIDTELWSLIDVHRDINFEDIQLMKSMIDISNEHKDE